MREQNTILQNSYEEKKTATEQVCRRSEIINDKIAENRK